MTAGVSKVRRGRHDRGVAAVEAAFVLPLFLFLVFGMIEFGYAEYLDSQTSSAARDGARVGVLRPTDEDAIEAAVQAKLVGVSPESITVTCLDGPSGNTTISCASAERNIDRIRVEVTESRKPITPTGAIFGGRTLRGSATMVVTLLPLTVSTPGPPPPPPPPPADCTALQLTATPAFNPNGDGKYPASNGTVVTVTTDGDPTCVGLKLELPRNTGAAQVALVQSGPTTWTYTIPAKHTYEADMPAQVRVLHTSGVAVDQGSFELT